MESRELVANKHQLRQSLRTRHPTPGSAVARRAAADAAAAMLQMPQISGARALLVCLSFGIEIDTWSLVGRLQREQVLVYVPRVDRSSARRMSVHAYPCALETLSFGLRQPTVDAAQLPAAEIDSVLDAALVLGVGFDQRGYRLGSGGGYFDRFLDRHTLPALALAYDEQIVDELPIESHDLPMTAVVTPTRVLPGDRSSTA